MNDSAALGMGWAVGRLSNLLGTRVSQTGVESAIVPSRQLPELLDHGAVVTSMALGAPLRLTFVMVLPRVDSELIFKMVTGDEPQTSSLDFLSVLAEVGNICISGYIAALADLIKLRLLPTPPEARWGGIPLDIWGGVSELVLVRASFVARGLAFGGKIFLIPDPRSAAGFLRFLRQRTRVIRREVKA